MDARVCAALASSILANSPFSQVDCAEKAAELAAALALAAVRETRTAERTSSAAATAEFASAVCHERSAQNQETTSETKASIAAA